jgi:hypothetical protein
VGQTLPHAPQLLVALVGWMQTPLHVMKFGAVCFVPHSTLPLVGLTH